MVDLSFPPQVDDQKRFRLINIDHIYNKPLIQRRAKDTIKLKKQYAYESKDWLVIGEKGGVCKACKLFITPHEIPRVYGRFLSVPWTQYSRKKDIDEHASAIYHKNAVVTMNNFKGTVVNRTQTPINQLLDSASRKASRVTTERLNSVIRCIVFCARQGIALRGHRNESSPFINHTLHPKHIIPGDVNRGNLLMVIDQRRQVGDTCLDSFKHKRAKYTSPECINELISLAAHEVLSSIVADVKRSEVFTIIADETRDVSNVEQLCVAVRYYNIQQNQSDEKFLAFLPLESLRG